MSKEIIFFHPYFSNGGVERTNIGLAKGLLDHGYHVVFLTTSYSEHFLDEVFKLGIEFISLGNKQISMIVFDLISFLNNRSIDRNIVFISCQYYVNVISMVASLLIKRRKNVFFINSERNHINELNIRHSLKDYLIIILVKILYRYSDKIIANSQETADSLSKIIQKEVCCVYNPTINTRLFKLKDEEIYESWYKNDGRKIIIGIGRFCFQKDFYTLIRAFKEFNNVNEYKLVIIGDGPEKTKIEEFVQKLGIKEHVILPGYVKNPYKFLKYASLFVLSSLNEGLPNVLIEALYLGVPSISTKCKSGPAEILLNDDLLVEVGNYKDMAKKMDNILKLDDDAIRYLFKKTFNNLYRFEFDNSIYNFLRIIET